MKYLLIGLIILSLHFFSFNTVTSASDTGIYNNFSLYDFQGDQEIPLNITTNYEVNAEFKAGENIFIFSVDDNSEEAIRDWWFKFQIKTITNEIIYSAIATADLGGGSVNDYSEYLLKVNIEKTGKYILNIDIISRPNNFNDFNSNIIMYNADSVKLYYNHIFTIANTIIRLIHFISTMIFVILSLLAVFFQIVTYNPDIGQESSYTKSEKDRPFDSRLKTSFGFKRNNYESNVGSSALQRKICSICGTYNEQRDRKCSSCGAQI